jgi:hypothetical protein
MNNLFKPQKHDMETGGLIDPLDLPLERKTGFFESSDTVKLG